MVRTMQAKGPSSSASKKKRVDASTSSSSATATTSSKRTKNTSSRRRASLSQCKSASLRLFRRVADEANKELPDGATPITRLSQRAHDHMSFLIRGIEQQLFGHCRKLMRTRTMSPKLLTVSMFMGFDKDLAKEAAKQAFRTRARMDELDHQFEQNARKLKGG